MGRLLRIESCKVCNYHIEDVLHFGNSTRTGLFIHHRYEIGHCHDCSNLVSVLVPTPDYDMPQILADAERDLATLKARTAEGDPIARRLLPLHEMALQDAGVEQDSAVGQCTVCGSSNVQWFDHVGGDDGEHFDDGTAWLDCPLCPEGRIWVRTVGRWDEIDSGL